MMTIRIAVTLCVIAASATAAFAANLPSAKPESVGISSERLARIDEAMDRLIKAGELTGAVTAVARHGKLVHLKAHGTFDPQTGAPMRTDALFRMASSSKPVTAVAVLMLVEQGKIGLDDPVSKYIPEFRKLRVAVPRAGVAPIDGKPAVDLVAPIREVTIHDLLTHTSGLMSGGPGQAAVDIPRKPEDTLATYIPRLGDAALDFQPGTKWSYSPLAAIDTLGRIIEIASGETFDVFLRKHIFEPLGMNDTAFALSAQQKQRYIPLYERVGGKWQLAPASATTRFVSETYYSGAAGLISTVQDYLAFEQMRLNGGVLNGKRLLSPASIRLMSMNHVGDLFHGIRGDEGNAGFGLTVAVTTDEARSLMRRTAGSSGWTGAFGTMSWIDPKEDLVAVLLIQQSGRSKQVDFATAVMQSLTESSAR